MEQQGSSEVSSWAPDNIRGSSDAKNERRADGE